MALIQSAQSGLWDDPATWQGGSVPNPNVDDVEIIAPHIVRLDFIYSVLAGRSVQIDSGAALLIVQNGALMVAGTLMVSGQVSLAGGLLLLNDDAVVEMRGTALVRITRREGGLTNVGDGHNVVDIVGAYGFAGPRVIG